MKRSLAAMAGLAFALTLSPASGSDWTSSAGGEITFVPTAYSPFPHVARLRGHDYQGREFPRDPHYVDSTTALFVPGSYRPGAETDLVFFFHGWNNNVPRAIDQFDLLEQFEAAGKNAILVFPEGPRDAPDSHGGKLEDEGGAARLAREVLEILRLEERIPADSRLGDVVFAGHSGAYRLMAFTARHGGLEQHLREFHLLDASYAMLEDFADWAERNPEGRLLSIYTEHLREDNEALMEMLLDRGVPFTAGADHESGEETLRDSPRVFLYTTTRDHNEAVGRFGDFLATSPHLESRTGQSE